ncbi:hypothetical protein PQX77_011880 [Marasmius sp. AFHP31]|nr:hypothetical protein PQX77_011880 [Marasmius sp. AFHP31]
MQMLAIITAIYTSILTLLTASRIWWMTRQAGHIAGRAVYNNYKIFIATIIESGLLFAATQVIAVLVLLIGGPDDTSFIPFDFVVISTQMGAIVPTLIVARIVYGQAAESIQQMVSTLQYAEGAGNNSQPQSRAIHCTVDLWRSLTGVEERGAMGRLETDKSPSDLAGICGVRCGGTVMSIRGTVMDH